MSNTDPWKVLSEFGIRRNMDPDAQQSAYVRKRQDLAYQPDDLKRLKQAWGEAHEGNDQAKSGSPPPDPTPPGPERRFPRPLGWILVLVVVGGFMFWVKSCSSKQSDEAGKPPKENPKPLPNAANTATAAQVDFPFRDRQNEDLRRLFLSSTATREWQDSVMRVLDGVDVPVVISMFRRGTLKEFIFGYALNPPTYEFIGLFDDVVSGSTQLTAHFRLKGNKVGERAACINESDLRDDALWVVKRFCSITSSLAIVGKGEFGKDMEPSEIRSVSTNLRNAGLDLFIDSLRTVGVIDRKGAVDRNPMVGDYFDEIFDKFVYTDQAPRILVEDTQLIQISGLTKDEQGNYHGQMLVYLNYRRVSNGLVRNYDPELLPTDRSVLYEDRTKKLFQFFVEKYPCRRTEDAGTTKYECCRILLGDITAIDIVSTNKTP